MDMSQRKSLWPLLGALLLLLALSALVESPADASAAVSPQKTVLPARAILLPCPPPASENTPPSPLPSFFRLWREALLRGLLILGLYPLLSLCRDANGRWIRKKRYVASVYWVFRQEAACG